MEPEFPAVAFVIMYAGGGRFAGTVGLVLLDEEEAIGEFDPVDVAWVIVVFEPMAGGEAMVEFVLLVEFAAKTGATPVALIKIPSNASALALILTKDEFLFLYLSNYSKIINF